MNTALALISNNAAVNSLIYLICIGIVFWLLWWLIQYVGLPEPFAKVAKVILAVAAVLILINILLGFAGHPIF
ncbi:MAG: hypothetical protein DMF62_03070 [Acidobacteria bacterium]|nr:MAG: hypothetical protein DMF62_03070 [Acidobacteriota bacterium]